MFLIDINTYPCRHGTYETVKLLAKIKRFHAGKTRADFVTKQGNYSEVNKAKLSQLETQNTSSAVMFIYNFQLREFRFVVYR